MVVFHCLRHVYINDSNSYAMKFWPLLKTISKNIIAGLSGAIIGILISMIYLITMWLPANAKRIGVGIIAVLPVMVILFSLLGIAIGGIVGIVIYHIIRLIKKK